MLRSATAISNVEAKRLIKAILAKEANELYLENGAAYASVCHALQSIGAEVEAVPHSRLPVQAKAQVFSDR
jgi:hypothetical protein